MGRNYTFQCLSISQALDEWFLKHHGCVFPLKTNKPNHTKCIIEKSHKSHWYTVIADHFQDWCLLPCETMKVMFAGFDSTTDNGIENETYVRFYMKDQIQVKTSILSYTKVSFLAEVGGYIGMLLGVSLMDFASLIDRMFAIINQKFSK